MLSFTNMQFTYATLPEGIGGIRGIEAKSASAAYAAIMAPPAPPRAGDTVSVDSLYLEMDHDQLNAFKALNQETQDRITTLYKEGKVSAQTVKQAMNLPLADVRGQRWNKELLPARLTDADRKELAEIEERRNRPGFRDATESMKDMQREAEIKLGIKVPEGKTGLPMPAGHPGVHVVRGVDVIENQKLKNLGVDIAKDPGFEERLMEKLRAGDIGQIDRSVHPGLAANNRTSAPAAEKRPPLPFAGARADAPPPKTDDAAKDIKSAASAEKDFSSLVSAFIARIRTGKGNA